MDSITSEVPPKKTSGYAIISLVLSILALLVYFIISYTSGFMNRDTGMIISWISLILFVIMFILSFIFGILALIKIAHNPKLKGRAISIVSITLSALVLASILFTFFLSYFIPHEDPHDGFLVTREPDSYPATADEPLTLSREQITTVMGRNVALNIAIYNIFNGSSDFYITIICNNNTEILVQSPSSKIYTIPSRESLNINLTLKMSPAAREATTYSCSVKAEAPLSNNNSLYSKEIALVIY